MSNSATECTFPSVTGSPLQMRIWLPAGPPKAVLQLVHGMAEHIDRYDETAKALNELGFVVVGHTHLGHGAEAECLGHFATENGWDALIRDPHALRLQTATQYPQLPYFLLGHSMGSFVVRTYCLQYEKGLAGVILSGTGHFPPVAVSLGKLIANLECAIGRAQKPSELLKTISSSGNNKKLEKPRTEFDWLSTMESVVDTYIADPYCGFTFTAGGYRDMFTGLSRLYPRHLSAMAKDIPVYLFSGGDDPIGQYGEGVQKVAEEIKSAGVENVTVTLYPGYRHEMFNEPERYTVWKDLGAWMDRALPDAPSAKS